MANGGISGEYLVVLGIINHIKIKGLKENHASPKDENKTGHLT